MNHNYRMLPACHPRAKIKLSTPSLCKGCCLEMCHENPLSFNLSKDRRNIAKVKKLDWAIQAVKNIKTKQNHPFLWRSNINTWPNPPFQPGKKRTPLGQPVLFQAAPEAPWLPPHCTARKWLCTNSQGLGGGRASGTNSQHDEQRNLSLFIL